MSTTTSGGGILRTLGRLGLFIISIFVVTIIVGLVYGMLVSSGVGIFAGTDPFGGAALAIIAWCILVYMSGVSLGLT